MANLDINPFVRNFRQEYLANRIKGLLQWLGKPATRSLLGSGSGVLNLGLEKVFTQAIEAAFNDTLKDFTDLLVHIPNGKALTACNEYRIQCLHWNELEADKFMTDEMARYGSVNQMGRHQQKYQRDQLTVILEMLIPRRINMICSTITARNNPLWKRPSMIWVGRLGWVIAGGLVTLACRYIISAYL